MGLIGGLSGVNVDEMMIVLTRIGPVLVSQGQALSLPSKRMRYGWLVGTVSCYHLGPGDSKIARVIGE